MKANRKFLYDEEAVSPVIAVILMVAITVVLAATVFVLVSDIGSKSSKSAPQIGWSDDEAADKMTVTQAPTNVDWKDFQIKASGLGGATTLYWKVSGNAQGSFDSTTVGTYKPIISSPATQTMQGGDAVQVCANAPTTSGVTFTLLHTPSNAIAHQFTFALIDHLVGSC